ncbi:MAG: hypothetical protein HXY21_01490 [Parvularculaceae bacterium]|nr:hypothetical protein [Parvularculaceae bacterium]
MRIKLLIGAAVASAFAAAGPAVAWDRIGQRNVQDRAETDTMIIEGRRKYDRIKVCVYRQPVHFIDVDIAFRNGGRQDVSVAARINPGDCTRVIDLEGGQRDIQSITFRYEETSRKRRTATVRVFAE